MTAIQKKQPLKKITHPFFKGLAVKYQKFLLQNASLEELTYGQPIFRDGEKAEKFYLLLAGSVNILNQEQDVRYDTESSTGVLQTLRSGDVIGWSWLIPPYRWRFHVVAHTEVKLLVLDAKAFRKKMEQDHTFGYEIYKRLVPVMNARLNAARLKLEMFGGRPFHSPEGA